MNATIAEFLLRQASDAKELAQRAQLLAALTQLSPQRRNELAQAVDMVCRTIAAHGGKGKVRFALVQRGSHRCIEVSVLDLPTGAATEQRQEAASQSPASQSPAPQSPAPQSPASQSPASQSPASQSPASQSPAPQSPASQSPAPDNLEAAVIQRVGELVDHFESSGWPVAGAVIRMAQTLSPAFAYPTESEVAEWGTLLKANTAFDALSFALRRARSLEEALDRARSAEELRAGLAARSTDAENLTMLSLVIGKTKNAIAIMEPDGTITAVNAAFVQMTGYAPAEAVGQRFDELLHGPSTDAAALGGYRRAREAGIELVQDLLLYRKDGATFWIESDLIPVADAAGRLTRWIAIGNDITKRRQTEDALRAAKETAETNSRLKSEFLANLSHEIRTPMNAIMGMTELALATPLSDEQRKYLQTVRSSSELLLGLLNDILDLSKIEAGKMEMEEIDFSLADVVQDTVKTLEVKAGQKSLELTAAVPDSLPAILRGDPTRLRQILLNLIGNAIKFTDQGSVTVTVEEQWRSDTEISLHFAVRDTGIGIPAAQLDRVFEAFKQGDASTTRKYGGSGLGLTISSELVRMMKGRIWVQSTVGHGSTFHFTVHLKWSAAPVPQRAALTAQLPRALPRPVETEATPPLLAPAARPLRILVADDHDANRNLVTTVLSKRGHACVEAVNGQQVLEALARQPFDAVLMDVQMPDMDGYQATAAIRKREEQAGGHVPIIALTAHAMSGDRERCLLAGMDAYLAKPLRPSDLVQLVETVPAATTRPGRSALPATDENPPGYDLQAALASLDNDVDLLISQMGFFVNDAPVLMEQIKAAIQQRDFRQLQLAAHRLKGMVARYACTEAAALALSLEQQGQQGALAGAEHLATQLAPLVARLADGIQAYIRQHATAH